MNHKSNTSVSVQFSGYLFLSVSLIALILWSTWSSTSTLLLFITISLYCTCALVLLLYSTSRWKSIRFHICQQGPDEFFLEADFAPTLCGKASLLSLDIFYSLTLINKTISVFPESHTITIPVHGRRQNHTEAIPVHGLYCPEKASIILTDPACFFRITITTQISAFPNMFRIPHSRQTTAVQLIDETAPLNARTLSLDTHNEEPADSRIYVPGDDTRTINWKQFGHTGCIAVRNTTGFPPQHKRIRFVFFVDTVRYSPDFLRVVCESLTAFGQKVAEKLLDCHTSIFFNPVSPQHTSLKNELTRADDIPRFFSDASPERYASFFEDTPFTSSTEQIICFCTPGAIPDQSFPHIPQDTKLYIGPSFLPISSKPYRHIMHSLICIDKHNNIPIVPHYYSESLQTTLQSFTRAGFNVSRF